MTTSLPLTPEPPSQTTPNSTFEHLISRLDQLSRRHLLFFRIEVGRAVLEELYGGDVAALRDPSPNKEHSLRGFVRAHAERLADLGLSEALLRQSIEAHLVVVHLPEEVVRGLVFSHVVHLSQVEDLATRGVLARSVVDNGWSGSQLADAVARVRAGLWIDAQPETPGLQPLPPEGSDREVAPEKPLPPARVVTRVEKGVAAFAESTAQWAEVDVGLLTEAQRARVVRALAEIEAQVAKMRGRLS